MFNFEEALLFSDEEDQQNELSDVSDEEEYQFEVEEPSPLRRRVREAQANGSQSSSSAPSLPGSEVGDSFKRVEPEPIFEYVISNKRNPILLYNSHFYYLQNIREEMEENVLKHIHKIYYCVESKKGCPMQVRFKDDCYDKELKIGHNHTADPVRTKKKIAEQKTKYMVSQNPELSCRAAIHEAMQGLEEPVVAAINSTTLRKTLEYQKRKAFNYPSGKTDPTNLWLPPEWLSFDNEEPFVIHDSGSEDTNRFIVLSSVFMLQKLVRGQTIAMDGTFKTRPRKSGQVFAIHLCVKGRFVPAVTVIMEKRNRASYLSILQQLTAYMEEKFNEVWKPQLILIDFEIAQRSAISHHFPSARHKCCYFHYAQAIQRWIGKVKLEKKYQSDVLFNEYIGLFRSLSFIPEQYVLRAFNQLTNLNDDIVSRFISEVDYPGITRFLAYFKSSWISKVLEDGSITAPRFFIDLWNHHRESLEGDPTTTCSLESWHKSINAVTRERGNSMWKCLKLFKTKIGTISRNQWIQFSSLSSPERSESRLERQKLAHLQQAIRNFNEVDLLGGLKTILRTLRNVESDASNRWRVAAMAEAGLNAGGTPRTSRRRMQRN